MSTDTAASSVVSHHTFRAHPWWERCAVADCRLSMAAHADLAQSAHSAMSADLLAAPYRCPECVWASEYGRPPAHLPPFGCPRREESA